MLFVFIARDKHTQAYARTRILACLSRAYICKVRKHAAYFCAHFSLLLCSLLTPLQVCPDPYRMHMAEVVSSVQHRC